MVEVNNKNDVARMQDGDCRVDTKELEKFLEPEKSWSSQMCIEFNDLCYSIRRNHKGTEKTILHKVTGHFEPGKLTVIIGPSGAGKTTLLKIISGKRLIDTKGIITVNGVELNREMFRKQVCYVPQEFDLLPLLTTRETLYIATRLKLDDNLNKKTICSIVNDIAESLGLSNTLDTLANKLSGGERKRLSIGVEMIAKPSVLLLDEPTSGLDSVASNQLVNMLHDMAKANCTMVCAIHQPSSQMISLFDDIMVLNQGRCMYCGPKSEILNTYSIAGFACPSFYNIAEFVLEVVTDQRGGDLKNLYKICRVEYEKFKSSIQHNKNKLVPSTDYKQCEKNYSDIFIKQKKSTWQQQKILFLRALICMKRDRTLTQIRLATHILVGILIGLLFYNFGNNGEKTFANIGYLFFSILFLFMTNSGLAVLIFPVEAAVFLQEHLNNWYSLKSYYSVKILTDLFMQVLCCSSYLFVSYYMTGQLMEFDRILGVWSICLLITIIGQTFGILAGTFFGVEIGIFILGAINVPLVMFAGFVLKLDEMPGYLQAISIIDYFKYSFEGLMQMMYLDRSNLACSEIYCYLASPKKILWMFGLPSVSFYVILIVLCSWIFGLHVITYAIFRWKIYNARN